MTKLVFTQDTEEPELWAAENVAVGGNRVPIHVMVQTDGEAPGTDATQVVKRIIAGLDERILAAADLLLENYSYEHWKKLGFDDAQLLREENPAAMAQQAVLRALWLFDEEGDSYELWFTLPWDTIHTYDVEFEQGEPVLCSVND